MKSDFVKRKDGIIEPSNYNKYQAIVEKRKNSDLSSRIDAIEQKLESVDEMYSLLKEMHKEIKN